MFEAIETAPIDWFRAELSFRQDILRLAKMLIQLAGSTIPIKVLYGKGNKSEHFIRNVQKVFHEFVSSHSNIF